ncbi:AAA family ATPase [Chloroflexota bacterium]
MTDLFDHALAKDISEKAPLAARLRPITLDDFVGQEHIIGEGKLLRRAIQTDRLFSSIILWGPPGTGKTTLAQIITNTTESYFETISAVLAGIPELRRVIKDAQERRKLYKRRTILFIDEVHRWNKTQQDALLPHVENGLLILIGATTENPYFEVIKALVSRSRIFQLSPHSSNDMRIILERALTNSDKGYGEKKISYESEAINHLIESANGDARNVLNALELAVESTSPNSEGAIHITLAIAQESIQRRAVLYDKDGDSHYDTISAFIKSVRGSDPDASLYWLAKMIYAGEDPRFILRRLLVLASEDIGLADPMGIVIANSALQSYEFLGLPEGIYPIAEATLYLATAKKSNSTGAVFKALSLIENDGVGEVPQHLKDSNRDCGSLGHGKDYQYPHMGQDHFIPQQYLPKKHLGKYFYSPSEQGYEREIKTRLEIWREAQRKTLGIASSDELPELSQELIDSIKKKTL